MRKNTETFYEKLELHRKIVTRLNYNPYKDFIAGIILSLILKKDDWENIPRIREANVIGPWNFDGDPNGFNIVADSALSYYHGHVDMIVSDLDGPFDRIKEEKNSIKVVHAHGDNIERIIDLVPKLDGIILGTTQSIPIRNIRNIGGFTDGDRSIIMASLMGAEKVKVYGFNWDDPVDQPKEIKKKKMLIGREIIEKLTNIKIIYMEGK